MDLLHMPLSTGAEDDIRPDKPARYDYEVQRANTKAYFRNRGRVCAFPGCDTKLRYSRKDRFCSLHEDTEEARKKRRRPGPRPSPTPAPLVPGLRPIRLAQGISRKDFANLIGRSTIWVSRVELGKIGAPDEPRRRIVEVLEISEDELYRGEFTKGSAGRPKGSK